jgi:aspartyl-tRNA(Asn)/glutamyl-tRNA(Gln) amidotransferase subunit C
MENERRMRLKTFLSALTPFPYSSFAIPHSLKIMPITQTEVEKVAALANLELTAEEKELFSNQLAAIIEYVDQLNEIDTSAVEPWRNQSAGAVENSYATRDDKVEPSLGQQKALDQAPERDDGHFLVPRVIGG